MAGKITDLSAQTGAGAATSDLLETVDVSDTSMAATGTNKRLSLLDLITFPAPTVSPRRRAPSSALSRRSPGPAWRRRT